MAAVVVTRACTYQRRRMSSSGRFCKRLVCPSKHASWVMVGGWMNCMRQPPWHLLSPCLCVPAVARQQGWLLICQRLGDSSRRNVVVENQRPNWENVFYFFNLFLLSAYSTDMSTPPPPIPKWVTTHLPVKSGSLSLYLFSSPFFFSLALSFSAT